MRHAKEFEFLGGQATDAKGEKEAQETEVDAESLFALQSKSPSFHFYGVKKCFTSSRPQLEQGAEAASPDEEV